MEDDSIACSCHKNGGRKIHNYFVLETMLPVEYNYLICSYNESTNHTITSRFHLNCYTKDEALDWLEKCSSITKLCFSIEKEDDTIYARCSCTKNEDRCKTALEINLKPNYPPKESSINEHQSTLQEYPTSAVFHYTHDFSELSHMFIEELDVDDFYDLNDNDEDDNSLLIDPVPLSGPKSKFKSKSKALNRFIRDKLHYLFERDYSPNEVYNLCKDEIRDVFVKYNTEETLLPNLKWVYDQFYDYVESKHGTNAGVELVEIRKRWSKCAFKNFTEEPTKDCAFDNLVKKPTAVENNATSDILLHSKIDELCKKYVPILPASGAQRSIDSDPPAISVSPQKLPSPVTTSLVSTPSYIIKFNPEPVPENLNLFPLKVLPNDILLQNSKLPELRIMPNYKDNHVFNVIGFDHYAPPIASISSNLGGIFILADEDQQSLRKSYANGSNLNEPSKEESPPQAGPRIRKHPRKASLKCEDPDEVVFTDKLEDLQMKAEAIPKKARRRSAQKSNKKRKVVQCKAIDGIENVICSD